MGTACLCSGSSTVSGGLFSTANKLKATHVGFKLLFFSYSDEYLGHWESVRGSSRKYPVSEIGADKDVLAFQKTQLAEIEKRVQDKVKSGSYKQGKSYRVLATSDKMPRPSRFTDFHYAIGGCDIDSNADVTIGKADSKGKIECTITRWESVLTDIYKFDRTDSFNVPGTGIPYFPEGELYDYEKAGSAKRFDISTSGFYAKTLLVKFTINK